MSVNARLDVLWLFLLVFGLIALVAAVVGRVEKRWTDEDQPPPAWAIGMMGARRSLPLRAELALGIVILVDVLVVAALTR